MRTKCLPSSLNVLNFTSLAKKTSVSKVRYFTITWSDIFPFFGLYYGCSFTFLPKLKDKCIKPIQRGQNEKLFGEKKLNQYIYPSASIYVMIFDWM